MKPAALLLTALLLASCASTPQPTPGAGIQRTIVQRFDIEGGKEVVLGIAEIAPGVAAGRHSHHGIEAGYVMQGEATLEIDGEAPRLLKAGDSFVIPAGKIHNARALGNIPAKVFATYVVEKGKPLATPAP